MKFCAVVFSSVFSRNYGNFIDTHDLVFRFNMAPTHGYEEIVGKKTTHMVLHNARSHSHPISPLSRWLTTKNNHTAVTFHDIKVPDKFLGKIIVLRHTCNILRRVCSSGFNFVHFLMTNASVFMCNNVSVIGTNGKQFNDTQGFHYYNEARDGMKNTFTSNYKMFHFFNNEAKILGEWESERKLTLYS
jgi:hypothetical protein